MDGSLSAAAGDFDSSAEPNPGEPSRIELAVTTRKPNNLLNIALKISSIITSELQLLEYRSVAFTPSSRLELLVRSHEAPEIWRPPPRRP